MKVLMRSFSTLASGLALSPGDIVEFDDAEAERLVSVGGARYPTEAEIEAHATASAARVAELEAAIADATIADLRKYAADHGIELAAEITKKADIIAAIELAIEAKKPAA